MRESPYIKSLPYHMPAVLGLALVLAVTGPFGTYHHMALGTRLVYFVVLGALNWLQVVLLAAWFGGIEPIDRWPVAGRMALVGVLAAVPGTFEIYLVHAWLAEPIPFSVLPVIYPENAFLTVMISVAVGLFVEQRLHALADAERARVADLPQPVAAPDFFRRIPPALGCDLLALEMEDHYLRIHTAVGSDLILLRLRDAMAELGPERGRQVHRSWWVANGAVQSTERNGGRAVLVLRNGLRVPVSKTFRDRAKEAGWL
jgi:DNA-binding LytR/AlgR family response regulator